MTPHAFQKTRAELESENQQLRKEVEELKESKKRQLQTAAERHTEDLEALSKERDELREALEKSLELAQKTDYLYREDRRFFYNNLCATIDYIKAALSRNTKPQAE